jgi:hypothetical protein
VLTQPISCCVAPRFPAICGRATFTIVVSSTSMIAAVISPSMIHHRYSYTYASIPAGTGLPRTSAGAGCGRGDSSGSGMRRAVLVLISFRSKLRREPGRLPPLRTAPPAVLPRVLW